jgi:uncharacterized membrane protein YphA (DoxX/SURF4 family)
MTIKAKTITYWATTGFVALAFLAGGVADTTHAASVGPTMVHLGYPLYVATLLGIWKALGAVAILAPRLPRLKEWAYAGMFFDLTGAAVSHASSGDPAPKIITPLALLVLVLASWALRPASRMLAGARDAGRDAAGAGGGERDRMRLRNAGTP